MPVPVFSTGEVLTAANMNAVGLWRVTGCTVTSAGGTAATASNGVITVGSGNTSVTVNNAFSTDYDNYLIFWNGGTMSNDTAMKLRLGTTNTNYFGTLVYTPNYTGTTIAAISDNAADFFTYIGGGNTNQAQAQVTLLGPNTATRTFINAPHISYGTVIGSYSGYQTSTTQFTSFRFEPFSGTMSSGTIRVYGYRK